MRKLPDTFFFCRAVLDDLNSVSLLQYQICFLHSTLHIQKRERVFTCEVTTLMERGNLVAQCLKGIENTL